MFPGSPRRLLSISPSREHRHVAMAKQAVAKQLPLIYSLSCHTAHTEPHELWPWPCDSLGRAGKSSINQGDRQQQGLGHCHRQRLITTWGGKAYCCQKQLSHSHSFSFHQCGKSTALSSQITRCFLKGWERLFNLGCVRPVFLCACHLQPRSHSRVCAAAPSALTNNNRPHFRLERVY